MAPTALTATALQHLAPRLIIEARAFLESARRLDTATRSSAHYAGPTYYLLCHGIELTLKAYLAASGVSERELHALRHDLKRAMRRARKHGFVPADDRFPELVKWLAPYHRDHSFRYPTKPSGGPPHQYPSLAAAREIADKNAHAIDSDMRRKSRESS
jgi:hypothetical protein